VATAAVLRGFPWPLRGLRALAGRGRGAVGPVGMSRAATSWAAGPLPLLVLTLAGTLAVCTGLLRAALVDGQAHAAWERVGAEARVLAPAGAGAPVALAGIARAPGVRHAAIGGIRPDTAYVAGDSYGAVRLLLVDAAGYDGVLRDTPLPYHGELTRLAARAGPTPSIPVLASPELAARIASQPTRLSLNGKQYPATVLGALSVSPAGWLPGDTLVVDRAAVAAVVGAPLAGVSAVVAWATGPGAGPAIQAAAAAVPGAAAQTRAGWLAANTRSPLVGGTLRLLAGASAAVAGYAGVALLLVVLATAAARNRTLAYLRTLGLAPGRGRLVAALELGPVVAAAGLAGAVGGVLVPLLLRPALGLVALTGGVTDPPLAPPPATSLGLAAALLLALAGLLVLALLVDGLANRRQRLDAVLRVGAG
jgi:putative ABC transport system permease protein